jgi:hypothetical protein
MVHAKKKIATDATSMSVPELTSCEAAPVGAVVDCTTVVAAIELGFVVALATKGPEGDRLVKERVAELNVVLRGRPVPVPMLAAVPTNVALVMFIALAAVAFDVGVAEYAMLDDPVPPTREKRPE